MKKISIFAIISTLFMTGCFNYQIQHKIDNLHQSDNMEHMSDSFKKGMEDGCATAKGEYTKDSTAFNSDEDYKKGWFEGQRKCHNPEDNSSSQNKK